MPTTTKRTIHRDEHLSLMSRQLDSDYLRASALSRKGLVNQSIYGGHILPRRHYWSQDQHHQVPLVSSLTGTHGQSLYPSHTPFTAVSLLCNVHMRTHRDKYNMQDTLTRPDLSPGGQHRGRKHVVVKLPGIEFSPSPSTAPALGSQTALCSQRTLRTKQDEISNQHKNP